MVFLLIKISILGIQRHSNVLLLTDWLKYKQYLAWRTHRFRYILWACNAIPIRYTYLPKAIKESCCMVLNRCPSLNGNKLKNKNTKHGQLKTKVWLSCLFGFLFVLLSWIANKTLVFTIFTLKKCCTQIRA